jgi:hypothetical protein
MPSHLRPELECQSAEIHFHLDRPRADPRVRHTDHGEITFTDEALQWDMSGKLKLLIVLVVIATAAYVLLSESEPVEITVEE